MNDITVAPDAQTLQMERPQYEPPSLKVMERDEVLEVLQVTASEISAAGCWWNPC